MANLPRSVQVVTLKLTPEEKANLRRDLELSMGMRYTNETMVNDCGTMIVRALRRHTSINVPRYLDAFPNTIAMHFALRKALGDSQVGDFAQVAIDQADRPMQHLVRNLYINIMEAKVFLYLLPQNAYFREWLEIYHRDNPELQYYDPETLAEIQQWAKDVRVLVNEDPQIKVYRIKLARLRNSNDVVAKKNFLSLVEGYLNDQRRQILESSNPSTFDMKDSILSEYRLDTYEEIQHEFELALKSE